MLAYILPFLLVISILVFVHEMGHYLVARYFNVHVVEFAIGFGPKLFSKKDKYGTEWKVCMILFGGYVKMLGDENAASFNNKRIELPNDKKIYSLDFQAPYKKLLVALAGPVANFIFAICIYFAIGLSYGIPHNVPIISEVKKGSIAESSGLQAGDFISSINGVQIHDFRDIRSILNDENVQELSILIKRDSVQHKIHVHFPTGIAKLLGITSSEVMYKKGSITQILKYSISQVYHICNGTLHGIAGMITKKTGINGIGGPIAIAKESYKASNKGGVAMLLFMAFISTTLGLMNLLPIPLLDGGHIVIHTAEMVMRRKLHPVINTVLMYFGLFIVIGLMSIGMWNDITSLLKK